MFLSFQVRVSDKDFQAFRFSDFHVRVSDIQATIECWFTLKGVRDMLRAYSQMHRTDKYSRHSPVIWPAWPNGWLFVYELSGCGFGSSCSHLNSRFRVCFEQGVPWHSGSYRVWIHSETRTWHDKNIQSVKTPVFVIALVMPDFGISTAIFKPVDIFYWRRSWILDLYKTRLNHAIFWKDKHE